jgi:hypothetical protein
MSELSTRALVLRQFAALRRQGLEAGAVLQQLGAGLPEGSVRADCLLAERALASGQRETGSDFTRLLTDPNGAPEQVEALAEALETRLDAEQALLAPSFTLQVALIGPPLVLAFIGWAFPVLLLDVPPERMPGPTQVMFELSQPMRFLGVPLAIGLYFALRALRARFSPGFQVLTRAADALQASTRPEADVNVSSLGFTKLELVFFQSLSFHATSSVALRTLAEELRREGREAVAKFRAIAPVVGLIIVLQFYTSLLIALYLPIFSIAGAIK